MNPLLRKLLTRYQAPAKGEGEDLPGAEDYGDDFTPTDDGADVAADRAPTGTGADDADPAPGDKDEPSGGDEVGQGEPLRERQERHRHAEDRQGQVHPPGSARKTAEERTRAP